MDSSGRLLCYDFRNPLFTSILVNPQVRSETQHINRIRANQHNLRLLLVFLLAKAGFIMI